MFNSIQEFSNLMIKFKNQFKNPTIETIDQKMSAFTTDTNFYLKIIGQVLN